jgi:hypothetical protein
LRGVPHRVEAEELGLADAVRVSQVLEARLQDTALGVLVRDAGAESARPREREIGRFAPEHDDSASVVVVEIDTLRHLASSDGE